MEKRKAGADHGYALGYYGTLHGFPPPRRHQRGGEGQPRPGSALIAKRAEDIPGVLVEC